MRPPVHKRMKLPRERTALLLVDLQEEQRSDPDYHAEGFDALLARASALLDAARGNTVPVAHAAYVRDFAVEPPRPFEVVQSDGSSAFSAAKTGLTDICGQVAPIAGEDVFIKNDASAFCGTDLDRWLKGRETEWIVICGVWTEACVAATVRDAMVRGYRVLLIKDACGSGSRMMHETAVLNLANRLYGGGICDTDRAIGLLSGGEAEVWQLVDPVPIRFTDQNITERYEQL